MKMTELIEKDQYVYKCDACEHTFRAAEVKLVDPADNITISTPGYKIMCVEADGNICGKQNPRKADGDKLLACPKCGEIHFSGLDLKRVNRGE